MARGYVVDFKHDAVCYVYIRENGNAMIDIMVYEGEFSNGEDTNLAANVIAEFICAQCKIDERKCLLLDSFIKYKICNEIVGLSDQ